MTDSKNVLVVDDEANLAEALCRALQLLKADPWAAESVPTAEAALARLAERRYDVLVTDLRLPGMDGLELIRRTRCLRPGTRTVLVTAYGTPEVEAQGLARADAYLAKPFSLKRFTEVITQVVKQVPPAQA